MSTPPATAAASSGRLRSLTQRWRLKADDHVQDLAWSPDGRRLACAAISGRVSIAGDDGLDAAWDAHGFGVTALAWSPDGTVLATAGQDGCARLWRAAANGGGTPALLVELAGGAAWVEHLAWAPDGRALATTAGKILRLWQVDGVQCGEWRTFPSTLAGVAWRPGGRQLSVIAYGGAYLVEPRQTAVVKHLPCAASLLCQAWSRSGAFLAVGLQEGAVHSWHVDTGRDWDMNGFQQKVRELSWDPSGLMLACGGSPVITVWNYSGDGPGGREPLTLLGHPQPVTVLAHHPRTGVLASAGQEGSLVWWNGAKPKAAVQLPAAASALAWRPGSEDLAVGCADGAVLLLGR